MLRPLCRQVSPDTLNADVTKTGQQTRRLQDMTYEELAIMNLLRGSPGSYMARREIARKALGRDMFEENPHWVDPPLSGLLDQEQVEQDDSGHFRIKKYEG
jgi:hypothetical protein